MRALVPTSCTRVAANMREAVLEDSVAEEIVDDLRRDVTQRVKLAREAIVVNRHNRRARRVTPTHRPGGEGLRCGISSAQPFRAPGAPCHTRSLAPAQRTRHCAASAYSSSRERQVRDWARARLRLVRRQCRGALALTATCLLAARAHGLQDSIRTPPPTQQQAKQEVQQRRQKPKPHQQAVPGLLAQVPQQRRMMPSFIGLPRSAFLDSFKLARLAMFLVQRDSVSTAQPTDHVFFQRPPAGDPARRGDTLIVLFSLGPPPPRVRKVTVPPLRGLSRKAAEQKLRDEYLTVGRIDTVAIDPKQKPLPPLRAHAQLPNAGAAVDSGTPVSFSLTLPRRRADPTVPQLLTLDSAGASDSARRAGLQIEFITPRVGDVTQALVDSQFPEPGAALPRDRRVQVRLHIPGPPEPRRPIAWLVLVAVATVGVGATAWWLRIPPPPPPPPPGFRIERLPADAIPSRIDTGNRESIVEHRMELKCELQTAPPRYGLPASSLILAAPTSDV